MTRQELLLKQAHALGVIRAGRDAGLEKAAFGQYLSNAWSLGKGALGKVLSAGRAVTYGGGPMAEAMMKKFPAGAVGKKMFRDALMGGALGGTLNVATGDSETPWYERYGRGALGGAIGGAAFRGGIEGTRRLMGMAGRSKWLGSHTPGFAKRMADFAAQKPGVSRIGDIARYAKSGPGTMGETGKRLGMYALGGIPLAAGGMYAGAKGEQFASGLIGGGISPAAETAGVAGPAAATAFRGLSPTGAQYVY
ncbi:MAG: hypothetical protein COZ56_16010 [Armatimonadetes bacterium CG_4_8_14_3_um_filter_58_9]|nr:MAG: hypothetical protein COZ56_16010 [Armatimonadetes bacterium CG_4_8_14_3_um_filter_58_9]